MSETALMDHAICNVPTETRLWTTEKRLVAQPVHIHSHYSPCPTITAS